MILRYRFNLAVSRSLPCKNRFCSIFQRDVYYGKVHLRQMPNPAAYGRSDTHKMEQYLPCKQNTHLAAAQLEKGCKCSAEAYTRYAFSGECTDSSPCLSFSSLQFMTFYKPMGNTVCFNNYSNSSPLFPPQ